jgi:hypothetical protein
MSMAAIVLCTPMRARADTVVATVTGKVTAGTDNTGVFVQKNGPLAKEPFTLMYVLDDNPNIGRNCSNPPNYSCREAVKKSNPVTKVVLTIHGKPFIYGSGEFPTLDYVSTVSRTVHYGVDNVWVYFYDEENYDGAQSSYGSSWVKVDLKIKQFPNLDLLGGSWDNPLPLYKVTRQDNYSAGFVIYHYPHNDKPEVESRAG